MDQSSAWKANSLAGTREIPCVIRNSEVDTTTFTQELAACPSPEPDQLVYALSIYLNNESSNRDIFITPQIATLRQPTSYIRRMEVALEKFREKLVNFPVHFDRFQFVQIN